MPDVGDYVVATVESITGYGAYLKLEDYGVKAFLPISEVSSRWIRRISDVIRTGQRVVVKIIYVDRKAGVIDVSLKDVPTSDAKGILIEWERKRKADAIIRTFCEGRGLEREELEGALNSLVRRGENIYDVIERLVIEPELSRDLKLPEDLKNEFLKFIRTRVSPKKYRFRAIVSAWCKERNGVDRIKKFFKAVERFGSKRGLSVGITLVASPRYLVRVESYKPEMIKKHAKAIVEAEAMKVARELDVNYQVIEEKLEK